MKNFKSFITEEKYSSSKLFKDGYIKSLIQIRDIFGRPFDFNDDIILITGHTNKEGIDKEQHYNIKEYKFQNYYHNGKLYIKYIKEHDNKLNIKFINGEIKEIDTNKHDVYRDCSLDNISITDKSEIFYEMYHHEPEPYDLKKTKTLSGLLELSEKYLSNDFIEKHYLRYLDFYFSNNEENRHGRRVMFEDSVTSSDKIQYPKFNIHEISIIKDINKKQTILDQWINNFKFLSKYDSMVEKKKNYYVKEQRERLNNIYKNF